MLLRNKMKGYREIFTQRLIIVFEGPPYFFKRDTAKKRATNSAKAFQAGKWAHATAPCDCFWKFLLHSLQHNEYEVVGSPGEADAQLAFLQISGKCKYIISTSNDGDHMVYPGVDNVIFGMLLVFRKTILMARRVRRPCEKTPYRRQSTG